MSLVPVLDVEAPPPAPPASRGRLRALFLVVVAFVLTTALGFIPAASASPTLAIPVAKGIVAIAASIGTEKAFDAMMDTPSDWGPDGPDGDQAKKKRGKWGNRLKGLPGLAVGLIGGLFGAIGLGDMVDGVKAPEDFEQGALDVDQEDLGVNKPGAYRNFRPLPDTANFNVHSVAGVQIGPGLTIAFSCTPGRLTGYSCPGPNSTHEITLGAVARCFNTTTGEFYNRNITVRLDRPAPHMPSCWRQTGTTSAVYVNDPVQSMLFRTNPTTNTAINGYSEAVRVFNRDFDQTILPEDQQTTVTANVECRDPSTGVISTVSKTVLGASVIPTAQCPPGAIPESISWTANKGGISENLGGIKPKAPDAYPDCPPGKCVRVIYVDGVPCRVGIEVCYDWMNVQPPSRVRCEYGPYTMPIAECADLANIHKTTHGVTPDPKPEWDPTRTPGLLPSNPDGTVDWTKVGPEFRPDDNPNIDYKPPVRGPIIGTPGQTDPTNPPVTVPSNPPFPTVGVNPPISPPGVNPPKNPDAPSQNCIAQGWSWNPVDWVFVPVKCALVWAFIPKDGPGLIARANDTFNDTGMGDWLGIVPAWLDALPDAGAACMGPPLVVPASMGGATYYPLNACSDPMAKYAQMSRAVMTVVVSFAGVISIVNSVTLAFTGYRAFEREGLAIQAAAAKEAEARSK